MAIGRTNHRARGFTLIEIMVVLVIIGIVLAVAIPNLFITDDERVRQQAERLVAVLEQTRDDAAMRGRVIAVRLTETGVEFAQRDPDTVKVTWKPIAESTLAWKDGVRAAVMTTENASSARQDKDRVEDIVFVPAGVSKPFEIVVYAEQADKAKPSSTARRVLIGDALGNVSIRQ